MISVLDIIIKELDKNGINTYFTVTGGAIVPFVDAVGRASNTSITCFQHEQGAAMAAEGFYRASGKVAVVLVTSGPGVQNILNGICGCWYDSIPVLFISGQVNNAESLDSIQSKPRQLGFQECPVVNMFASCTKYSKKIDKITSVQTIFSDALTAMMSCRRGPVLIDFPVDIQMMKCDPFDLKININENMFNSMLNIRDVLHNSTRPIIIIGNGVRDTIGDVRNWIEKLDIPFVTSWNASDLIEHSHPQRIGYLGVYGDRCANLAVQNADLLIILGSRMDTRQTGGNLSLCSRESIKIMVDIDLEEITKLTERGFKIDIPIHNNVKSFISENIPTKHECTNWKQQIKEWVTMFGVEHSRKNGDIYTILSTMKLPDKCIIIPDCGGNLVWAMQSICLNKTQKLFTNFGNSSMGYALPAAIGAAIGTSKNTQIVCICGDGGIQMNIQELQTLYANKLPITILIINNNGYGIIRQFQDQYFNSRHIATSSIDVFGKDGVEISEIAKAYGINSKIITMSSEISFCNAPFLYDIHIDPNQKIFPKLEFGNSLEHMSPLIGEINAKMIVSTIHPNKGSGWVSK